MKNNHFLKTMIAVSCLSLLLISPYMVFAEKPNESNIGNTCGSSGGLVNPLGVCSIPQAIGVVLKYILGIVGSLALAMFVYGGLIWMTSMGNAENVRKGRDVLIWSTIGLVIIFGSYALVTFVLQIGS
ncbi:MAG: hypothetical protein COV80_03770 [Parcubacteria group bacterium CG11_big_fil_rev_8_21_14_0_20_48_46]|nr:MAG: hypothetical protein COV80_03770 [Parcubacteria group bacterium CG11_big_fil_rev_8_21_14_0_20_48_46]